MVEKTTSITFKDAYGVSNTAATSVFRVNEADSKDVKAYFRAKEIPFHEYASGREAYALEIAEKVLKGAVDCDQNKSASKTIKGYDLAISSRQEIAQEVVRPLLQDIEKCNEGIVKSNTLDYIGKNFTVEESTFLNASFAAAMAIEDENAYPVNPLNQNEEESA